MKPHVRPERPHFAAGPCAKRPGWQPDVLADAFVGRSHRAKGGKAKLNELCRRSRELLGLPEDYWIGIVPASDTGAFEMAMWHLLGARGVDVAAWDSFGAGWVTDIVKQLQLSDRRVFEADYGALPDLSQTDSDRDIVFTWNGTTAGVCVPDADWIRDDRAGLTLCDATSAVFAMDIPWHKIDVATYSWQKVLGGEAAHGMLILSPRAVERLESFTPPRPLPKIFRLTKSGRFAKGPFQGETINTPSMLCVEDCLDALRWAESIGGLPALLDRSRANLAAVERFVAARDWLDFLPEDPATRSNTSICLKITDAWFQAQPTEARWQIVYDMVQRLATQEVAYDINGHRDGPPGLRLWGGATVESADIEALMPWLDWAFGEAKQAAAAA